jgi:protein involved in temperature-dependent protein secretion
MSRVIALIVAAAAAGYGLHALAQNRLDVRTSAAPIGTSSSNGISFAWFYDSAARIVYVCRAGSTGDAIECKAKAQLP